MEKGNFFKQNIPFTQIANDLLNDKLISFKAKGVYSFLYSKPSGWYFSEKRISDVLIKASGFGFSGDNFVPRIQPLAWSRLNMTEQLLETIVAEIEEKLVATKNFSLEIQSNDEPKK